MCGICGELNFSGQHVSLENIKKMSDSLAHRGPDDSGMFCQGLIGLGHRRLAIIDLSPHGRQPMWSNDKSLGIVFNGEVYNYKEIRAELLKHGYYFDSQTDTEVVVNALHFWGIERALSKFIGMFAFAVWDSSKQVLYLARDRAGIKPLYYYINNDLILFASEMKGLLAHPAFQKELNLVSLGQYFITGYFLNHYTIFKNTYKLSPGHYMVVTRDSAVTLHKYWGLDGIKRGSFTGSFADAADHLEEILKSAFQYRLVADVPVGLFLSGGIDSSLVSAILKNQLKANILNITIGFQEVPYNEAPKAQQVSQELKVEHMVHYINIQEAQNTLLRFCDIYDEPFGDTSGIPTYILSKLAREEVKVALSADGGDEQFCGYESYISYCKGYHAIKRFPYLLRHTLAAILKDFFPYKLLFSLLARMKNKLSLTPQFIAKFEKFITLLEVNNVPDLIKVMYEKAWTRYTIADFLNLKSEDFFQNTCLLNLSTEDATADLLDTMMRVDYQGFLSDDILVKEDRASMAVSLECRDPFLDHRIAELAFTLPIEFLYKTGEHKRVLKFLLRKHISETIVASPKRGFSIPLYYWLKGIWKPYVFEYLSHDKITTVGVLDARKVQEEVNNFYKYEGGRAEKIWMMLNFQMWAEKWYLP